MKSIPTEALRRPSSRFVSSPLPKITSSNLREPQPALTTSIAPLQWFHAPRASLTWTLLDCG